MATFEIADGRDNFYQWDLDRELNVTDCTTVHFAHAGDTNVIEVNVVEGVASVPNLLLESAENLLVYAYDTNYTLIRKTFAVIERPMPEDYVPDSQVYKWVELEERIVDLEELTEKINSIS